jgi:acyl-CoA hydrolase
MFEEESRVRLKASVPLLEIASVAAKAVVATGRASLWMEGHVWVEAEVGAEVALTVCQ